MIKKFLYSIIAIGIAATSFGAIEDSSLQIIHYSEFEYTPTPRLSVVIDGAFAVDLYDGEGNRIIRRGGGLFRETEDGSLERIGALWINSVYGDRKQFVLDSGEYVFKNMVFEHRIMPGFFIFDASGLGYIPRSEWQQFEVLYGLELRVWADGSSEVTSRIPRDDEYQKEVNVTIDGETLEFFDQGPVAIDGRTLVPARRVFEALGFQVFWGTLTRDALEQSVMIINDDIALILTINSDTFAFLTPESEPEDFYFENYTHPIDVPAQLINGRTMVPIRIPLEAAGFGVDWDEETRTVIITRPIKGEV